METVKQDGDGLVCRRQGAPAVGDDCRGVSVTSSAEDGPRRRRGAAAGDGAARSGTGRRAHGGVRCPMSPATSFTQGARSSTPCQRRAPPQLTRARALAAASSSPRPRHGDLGTRPSTSSTPDCTGGPQQAAPRALEEKLVPATPVHGSSLSIEKEDRGCVDKNKRTRQLVVLLKNTWTSECHVTCPEAPDVRAQAFPILEIEYGHIHLTFTLKTKKYTYRFHIVVFIGYRFV
jgi:hypothetical protein